MAGEKKLPKTIAGIPTPIAIIGGVGIVAYFYLRHSSLSTGVQNAAGSTGKMGIRSVRGRAGPRGKRGKPGKTIRQVVLICPPGYHKVNRRCVKNAKKPHHPAHKFMAPR